MADGSSVSEFDGVSSSTITVDDMERWDCNCLEPERRLGWVLLLERPPEDEEVCTLFLLPCFAGVPWPGSILDLGMLLEVEAGNSDLVRLCLRASSGDLFRPEGAVLPEVVEARGLGVE